MSTEDREYVTLGADVGGKDAYSAVNEHVLTLRKLLKQECKGPYSTTVKEVALVLMIDGEVQSWGKIGVENVKLQRKKSIVTADIYMTKDMWSGRDQKLFRGFLCSEIRKAFVEIGNFAEKKKVDFKIDFLGRDFDDAVQKLLSD